MIDLNTPPYYEKEIYYNESKNEKLLLSISVFRGEEWLSIRKYYQDFDEEWKPTRDGIAIRMDFDNTRALFDSLVEILSISEVKDVLSTYFKETLDNIYQK